MKITKELKIKIHSISRINSIRLIKTDTKIKNQNNQHTQVKKDLQNKKKVNLILTTLITIHKLSLLLLRIIQQVSLTKVNQIISKITTKTTLRTTGNSSNSKTLTSSTSLNSPKDRIFSLITNSRCSCHSKLHQFRRCFTLNSLLFQPLT